MRNRPRTSADDSDDRGAFVMTDGIDVARGLLGAADVGDGPTDEQRSVITHLLHGYLGAEVEAAALTPLGPAELAAVADPADHKRIVDLLVVVEYCRHPGDAAQADRVEKYARALGVDEPNLLVARDALTATQVEVMNDWARFRDPEQYEPGVHEADDELAARLRALGDCAPGTLGRAYFDFYDRWNLPFPGEENGGSATLVAHDFTHVLAGYEPDPPGELALQAMLVAATGFEHHFAGLVASLSLYEAGKFDINDLTPKSEALARPGAAAELAVGFRRGQECGFDFSTIDHLARVDDPLNEVRADCNIPALTG